MDDDRVKTLSIIFRIPEEVMKDIIDKGKDLYDGISEYTGLSRSEVKHWAHGTMYSKGPGGLTS